MVMRDSPRTVPTLPPIARVWRGYCGRLDAGYLRAEMAKFLFAIREEEAKDEEEEYLATQRYKIQLRKERRSR